MKKKFIKLGLKLPLYVIFRNCGWPTLLPFNYTLSVTYKCNSRCKTCNIWKMNGYELSTEEWLRVLKSLGKSPFWITISGGEPLLRRDLETIVEGIIEYNSPAIINLPTNALVSYLCETVENILKMCEDDDTIFVINFSVDGIGKDHDDIRGVGGNWNKFLENYKKIKLLKNKYSNLVIGIHTVISKWNVDKMDRIVEYILNELKPDQYITEIAEVRREMNNAENSPTPNPESYSRAIERLVEIIEKGLRNGRWQGFARITESLRLEYYKYVKNLYLGKINNTWKSYAGFASCQIAPNGDVWECAVYATVMGNLRDYNYNFKKLWKSKRAREVRELVKKKHICPLANENYVNMLFNPKIILKMVMRMLI